MKGKQLATLAVAAVVLMSLAVYSTKRNGTRTTVATSGKLFPSLAINDVQSIDIRAPSDTVTVARVDGLWRVAERFQYPADFDKVRSLLNKLATVKSLRPIEANPQQRADLQLQQDAGGTAARPTVITLRDASGTVMETVLLGKERTREGEGAPSYGGYPDGRFVATSKGDVHLIGDTLEEAITLPRSWMDEEFVNLPAEEILSVEVTGSAGGPVKLSRNSGLIPFSLPSIPDGKETDESKLSRLTSALAYLRFSDVADPKAEPSSLGMEKPVRYTATTSKGVTCTLLLGSPVGPDCKHHTTLSMEFTPPPPPADPAAATNGAAKAQAELNARTAADVARLSAKLKPWTYVLGKYEAESLMLGYSDLLKDKGGTGTTPAEEVTK